MDFSFTASNHVGTPSGSTANAALPHKTAANAAPIFFIVICLLLRFFLFFTYLSLF